MSKRAVRTVIDLAPENLCTMRTSGGFIEFWLLALTPRICINRPTMDRDR